MSDIFIEHLVKAEKSPKTLIIKLAVSVGALLIVVGMFTLSPNLGVFSMLSPLIAVGAVYGAYYVITALNIEYEFAVTNGELDVDKIVAQRRRSRLVTVNARDMEEFGLYKNYAESGKVFKTKIFACDNPANETVWYCVANIKDKGKTLLVFNANEKMLNAMKPFLPRLVMHKAFNLK